MDRLWAPRPQIFLVLMMPYGIANGYVSIFVPFLIRQAGLSVAVAASAGAIALIPNFASLLWSPVIDLTLSFRKWYAIGVAASVASLAAIGFIPLQRETVTAVTGCAFVSQVGATLISLSVAAIVARTLVEEKKGRAAGWYQAGMLGGAGLGGGGGIWLVTHSSRSLTAMLLGGVAVAFAVAIRFVPVLRLQFIESSLRSRMVELGRELRDVIRAPKTRLVAVLVVSPIGVGAATNLWAVVASDWRASADFVAFATGVINGVAAAAGCAAGGWIADRVGRWYAFFGSGLMVALVAVLMADAPHLQATFGAGILLYAASQGLANAAFSALVLHVIGRRIVTTKYAIFSSLGNLPVSYMTAFDGFAHDRWGAKEMLHAEAFLGLICIASGLFFLLRLQRSELRETTAVCLNNQ